MTFVRALSALKVSLIAMLFAAGILVVADLQKAEAQQNPDTLMPWILCEIQGFGDPIPMLSEECDGQNGTSTPPMPDYDWCPNVPGDQGPEDFPACVIPDPATSTPDVDVCPNIDGMQDEVPEGYEIVDGQCVEISTPVDQCPNIEGVQETIPDGKQKDEAGNCVDIPTSGGGGSTPTPSSGGGGGGGGGGGVILGAATSSVPQGIACDQYLTTFIKPGAQNDTEQVSRLQAVLKEFEGADVELNGAYDAATVAAVHALQTKYAADILTPWGIKESTGYVYLTTRKKVNEIYCASQGMTFPLTAEEQKIVEKAQIKNTKPAQAAAAAKAVQKADPKQPKKEESKNKQEKNIEEKAEEENVTRSGGVWGSIRGLFDRMFNR